MSVQLFNFVNTLYIFTLVLSAVETFCMYLMFPFSEDALRICSHGIINVTFTKKLNPFQCVNPLFECILTLINHFDCVLILAKHF